MTKAELWGGMMQFMQPQDDMSDSQSEQQLNVHVVDGGAGKYLVIETTRWAVDSAEEFAAILNKVKQAFGDKS